MLALSLPDAGELVRSRLACKLAGWAAILLGIQGKIVALALVEQGIYRSALSLNSNCEIPCQEGVR